MVDIGKQIGYWRSGAEEDWSVGRHLVSRGSLRHGLFFAHLQEVLQCLNLQF
jgi:hypothetical protein